MSLICGCSTPDESVEPEELESSTVSDIDGNKYNYVQIGEQFWLTENLRTTKLNDGVSIDNIQDDLNWVQTTNAAYSWYDNDSDYEIPYGKLYNYFTVESGKLCPVGWRVPTDDDWKDLIVFLLGDGTGSSLDGDKIKDTDPIYWKSLNTGATNETGFTALPAGYRNKDGKCYSLKDYGFWWTKTEYMNEEAFYYNISGHRRDIERGVAAKIVGFSVRCMKE